ncbi:hypothetical protein PSCICN_05080 [Pseudomonas cichorii]|uniref:hypothetical protein n=1 Tax=Pseudomonas cichorii TaxID=36746 RepID=UPI001A0B1B37|nr:hypothetical protein [Pseudomonas cichorii]GFM79816.1 hypothetical protein PSCICN_05080 [Pseudomonas cichorii]
MHKNKRFFYRFLVSGALVMTCQSFAHTKEITESPGLPAGQEPQVQEVSGQASTFLGDRLNQVNQTLQSATSVHRYRFISLRGQDVLLATPGYDASSAMWKVEYQIDNGEWKLKTPTGPQAIRDLKPGSRVNVRVRAAEGASFGKADYRMVVGSYPHMQYELHDEGGFLKIPYGLTRPSFLATQAYTKVLLEATFTDSKAYPLAGGVMDFRLEPHEGYAEINKVLTSDSRGQISMFIEFGRCEGGDLAGDFVHRSTGNNIWSTRYKVGKYSAHNVLLESLDDKQQAYTFGHICKRSLVNRSGS